MEFGPRYITYNKANSISAYIIKLELPLKIDKFITIVYNTSVDPLLY
jgi:hypothetical protein